VPLNPDDQRSPYLQIADDLRGQITRGELTPGERLPSTAQLAERYGVAAMTVRNALRTLNSEGLVVARQGSGVFVRTIAKTEPDAPELDLHEIVRQINEMSTGLQTLAERVDELEALVKSHSSAAR
jgi:GntR family transcriptional regulator